MERKELTIAEQQAAALEVLHAVAQICEEQKITYMLQYGTLIGAIRHKGFIPWDDDIDIIVPRPDYDRLLAYVEAHSSDYPHLQLFHPGNCPDYPYMIARFGDDRYEIVMENEKPYGLGVFVDVYPYDGLGNTKEEALAYASKGDRLSSFCYQASRQHFAIETTKSKFRKLIKFPFYLLSKLIGKKHFQTKLERLARKYSYTESTYVGPFVWLSGGEKDIFLREWFDETIIVPFEQYEFRVPKQYDILLRHIYGDYMQLPPEEDRVGHHYYKTFIK